VSTLVQIPPPRTPLKALPTAQDRGIYATWCVIATEAMLFAAMFASYYYLGNNKDRWQIDRAPELIYPWVMFGIILLSNLVMYWGHRQVNVERFGSARMAIWIAFLLGAGFFVVQAFEMSTHWRYLTPMSDSYGSIFYTIEFLFIFHMLIGMLLLGYVGVLPNYAPTLRSPHKPYQTAAAYWYFIGALWLFIVVFLYSVPNIQRMYHGR
jgi:cytochrome c oxidase subunit III